MANSYLDKTGLQHFWAKIKSFLGNYNNLNNKPQINNVELNGNKTLNEIGVQQTQISTEEPTDESVQVWINPEGEPTGIPTKTSELVNDSGFATEEWVNNKIENIGITGSNEWEIVKDTTISNATTSTIDISFSKSYNEILVYIDLTGNNKQLGTYFWKVNGKNVNYTNLSIYRQGLCHPGGERGDPCKRQPLLGTGCGAHRLLQPLPL